MTIVVLLLSLISTFLWLWIALVSQVIVDKVIVQNSADTLQVLGLSLLIICLIASAFEVGTATLIHKSQARGIFIKEATILLLKALEILMLMMVYSPMLAGFSTILVALSCGTYYLFVKRRIRHNHRQKARLSPEALPLSFRLPLNLIFIFVFWCGSYLVLQGALSLGQLIAFSIFNIQFVSLLLRACKSQLQASEPSQLRQIEELTKVLEDKERSHKKQLQEIEAAYQLQKQKLEQSKQTEIQELRAIYQGQKEQLESSESKIKQPQQKLSTEATMDIKTIKIFLASSSELKDDREQFEIFINRKNKEYIKERKFIELVLWEDFLDAMSQTRLQDEYNKVITNCDVFVSLFHTKVGQYTEEEFLKALETFRANKRPLIYTYFKESPVMITREIRSLLDFQDKLNELGHFYTKYKDINDLKYRFDQQLTKFIPEL